MIEVGTPEVKTVYWIRKGFPEGNPEKLTLNCESIGSKRD
jgi:hypothetical protein